MTRLGSLNLKLLNQSMHQDFEIIHPAEKDKSIINFRPEVTLTIADELKRARAIAEIGSNSFYIFRQI